jgi:uncharacterized membrane protein
MKSDFPIISRGSRWSKFSAPIVLTLSAILVLAPSSHSVASATASTPTCKSTQLQVAVAWGPGAAAGNLGEPFIIINTSNSSCSLMGYPTLTFYPSSYKGTRLRITHRAGMIYKMVKPTKVLLAPGKTASFGLMWNDAYNQNLPFGAACTASSVMIGLPVSDSKNGQSFEALQDINFCYSNFEFQSTAIEAGPSPRLN